MESARTSRGDRWAGGGGRAGSTAGRHMSTLLRSALRGRMRPLLGHSQRPQTAFSACSEEKECMQRCLSRASVPRLHAAPGAPHAWRETAACSAPGETLFEFHRPKKKKVVMTTILHSAAKHISRSQAALLEARASGRRAQASSVERAGRGGRGERGGRERERGRGRGHEERDKEEARQGRGERTRARRRGERGKWKRKRQEAREEEAREARETRGRGERGRGERGQGPRGRGKRHEDARRPRQGRPLHKDERCKDERCKDERCKDKDERYNEELTLNPALSR